MAKGKVYAVPVYRVTVYRGTGAGPADHVGDVCSRCGTYLCECGSRECRGRCVWCDVKVAAVR
jgi:hypothetical protein